MIEDLANIDLERNFLSSIIKTNKFVEVAELVRDEHFTINGHKQILQAIRKIDDGLRELSFSAIGEELRKTDPDSLNDLKLIGLEEATSDIEITVIELIEWHNKRELYRLSIKMQEELKERKSSSFITKIIDDTTVGLDVSIGSRAKTYAVREKHLATLKPIPKFETGFSVVDDFLQGGISAGQLILVMGDPEAGKTILITQILHKVSLGFLSLFFPFEFTVRDYINTNNSKKRVLNKDNIYIVDDGYDISDVSREIKIFAKKGGRIVFIDSQMRLENSGNRGTAEQIESEKFSILAKLSHRLELIIFLIAQQGKEDTKGGVHTPMNTKKGAHEANQIWFIHKLKPKFEDGSEIDINAHKRLFEVSKNKQNGRHFKTEITLNPVALEFVRKYNKSPIETIFKSNEDVNDLKAEIPEMDI
ncbi:DnaB-like helicase N-terminal domain-containing protein [Aliarcobacter lanthieri]|uniref:DnaB-like helicase N-terminal domain-containing protein n=1 Tax=Aliarcobacter lanthieri TaxID=1355374 RepID=UPI003AB0C8E9